MYDKLVAYDYYTAEPWKILFPSRIKEMLEAYKQGLKIIVYLYEQADTSTFRYRAYNMCQVLQTSLEWHGVYFFKDELIYLQKYLDYIDIITIIRYRWDFELEGFLNAAKGKDIRLVFDVDDLIYDSRYVPLVTNTLAVNMSTKEDYDYWFTYTGRIRQTALKCDMFLSTNEYIRDIIKEDFGKNCYIMPNFFNRLQNLASKYLCIQKHRTNNKKPFVIGYFSGTPSHINDFLVIAPEIKSLLNDCPEMNLRIVGFMELPDYLMELRDTGRIQLIPLKNFIDLQKEIASVDVNIIPLQENKFCNCKSELKFFEASIVETISCASPTYVYKKIIQSGKNGYLCKQGELYGTIKSLYDNGIDRSMIKQAKRLSYNDYYYKNQQNKLENILLEIYNQSI